VGIEQPVREYPKLSDEKELETCTTIIDVIKDHRADEYKDWISIGMALHNTLNGSEEGLDLFLKFSRKCPDKFNELECRNVWSKFNGSGCTKGTLIYYFNQDNLKIPFRGRRK
jgi:hypothetical protein